MKIKIRRQAYMTMLEVLIAISLLAVLLSALLGFYQQIEKFQQKITQQKQENFRYFYLQYRLGQVLPKILNNFPLDKDTKSHKLKKFYLYSSNRGNAIKNNSLVFVFDNGIDGNPLFSNRDIGRLYIDKDSNLCLSVWPAPIEVDSSNPPMRQEILLDKVSSLSFEFYLPPRPNKDDKPVDPQHEQYHGKWLPLEDLDKIEYETEDDRELPPILRIIIEKDSNPLVLPFVLINSGLPIIFS